MAIDTSKIKQLRKEGCNCNQIKISSRGSGKTNASIDEIFQLRNSSFGDLYLLVKDKKIVDLIEGKMPDNLGIEIKLSSENEFIQCRLYKKGETIEYPYV